MIEKLRLYLKGLQLREMFQVVYMSHDMRFPAIVYFDKSRLRRACAAPF